MEVTFLFTKMSGSTELLQHLGDYRYGEVLAEHQRLLRAAFEAEGGQEVDTQSDAFFVAFPRAGGAVAAAAAAQGVDRLPSLARWRAGARAAARYQENLTIRRNLEDQRGIAASLGNLRLVAGANWAIGEASPVFWRVL